MRESSIAGRTGGAFSRSRSAGRRAGRCFAGHGPASELVRSGSRGKNVRCLLRDATSPAVAEFPTRGNARSRPRACRSSSSGGARLTVAKLCAPGCDGNVVASQERSRKAGCRPDRSGIQSLIIRVTVPPGLLQGRRPAARNAVGGLVPFRNPGRCWSDSPDTPISALSPSSATTA